MNRRFWLLRASLILSFCALLGLVLMVWSTSQARSQGTFIVTKITDMDDGTCDDDCTLREAINAANADAGANTITFSLPPSAIIILAGSQLPAITDNLTIDGSSSDNLTISGANSSRVFEIGSDTEAHITSLTVADGNKIFGGGILNLGTLVVSNSTFTGNSGGATGSGGGIANIGGTLSVLNSTFSDNYAGHYGGGIGSIEGGTLTISNSTFNGNESSVHGGGIGTVVATLTVSNSTFNGNRSGQHGGGIGILGGTLSVSNSTFNGNYIDWITGSGGGVNNDSGILTVSNSTFSGNSAARGGGIHNENGTLHLFNTIITKSPSGGDCANISPTIGTNINNLISDGSCNATFSGDPLLDSLQDNGGPTETHALLDGSPAIDAGEDSVCTIIDQRGYFRLGVCDIGAFEFGGVRPEYTHLPLVLRN